MHSSRQRLFLLCALAICACSDNTSRSLSVDAPQLEYPAAAPGDTTDDYHGTIVADPYRWLEGDVRDEPDVAGWVDAQNSVSERYLAALPERAPIHARLESLWDYERASVPSKRGAFYFTRHNDGLANQARVYRSANAEQLGDLILDPNTWSEDGTVALAGYDADPSGRYVAYLIQDGGSDWRTARIYDVQTGKDLPETLRWLKFTGISWQADGSGFYYSRYPATESGAFQRLNENHTVYFHRLNTEQSADEEVFTDPEHPRRSYFAEATSDGRHLLITASVGTDDRYEVHLGTQQSRGLGAFRKVVSGFDYDYSFVANRGNALFFFTNEDAPRGRVVLLDAGAPQPMPREIVATAEDTLDGVALVGDVLVLQYLHHARSKVQLLKLAGAGVEPLRELELPGIGTVSGFESSLDGETFFTYSSVNRPPTTYRYDVAVGERTTLREPDVGFDPDDFSVQQVFYSSRDGTRIPMLITHRKDVALENAPTLLYGYGGFNISLRPTFSVSRMGWLSLGGVYAVANLRGGGEYGSEWHKAGTGANKQNVFDDFIAAAEHLIDEGITSPEKLAIYGRSNGGLLVGAVLNQRPDLFAAALPAVGVMDMLRFQRFTAGRFWTDDYGASDNADEFAALHAYSPYHNIRDQAYPPVLITTADTDDRVVPGHSFKYAARLQAADTGGAPKLIRIETRAGHGSGKPTAMVIDEYADMWAFIAHHTGLEVDDD
ncbi:MAG: prolyl oligopeptidase family serine peptidase [Pseudomonadota bacterium]